jgi:hypothetical protein
VKHAWISKHRDSYPVKIMCRVPKMSRSGYYDSIGWVPSAVSADGGRFCDKTCDKQVQQPSKVE